MKKKTKKDLLYWVTILSACSMGETAGDFFSFGLHLGYALSSIILGSLLFVTLILEAKSKTSNPIRYWSTIIIMSTTGTALADYLTRTLELGYSKGSLLLISIFLIIYFTEGLVKKNKKQTYNSILPHIEIAHAERSLPSTDAFYWAAILVASTFGTTMGDFTSDVLGLGFGGGSLLLFTLLIFVLFFELRAKLSNKLRYWSALVISSTIGATTGDYLTKPDALNLGYAYGSIILITFFVAIVFINKKINTQILKDGDSAALPHIKL